MTHAARCRSAIFSRQHDSTQAGLRPGQAFGQILHHRRLAKQAVGLRASGTSSSDPARVGADLLERSQVLDEEAEEFASANEMPSCRWTHSVILATTSRPGLKEVVSC